MRYLFSQQPITLAILATAVLAIALAVFSLHQVQALSSAIDVVSTKAEFDHFFGDNAKQINQHIDVRIDAYIDRRKQEKVAGKFEAYELAAQQTRSGNKIYGHEAARFTLVEYSDLECPYCKRFHSVPKKVVDSSGGLVNWQWRHLPLPLGVVD